MDGLFDSDETNFLSYGSVSGLTVTNGDNILPTCFQYAVKDSEGNKVLTVKIYDKIIDLISREGF